MNKVITFGEIMLRLKSPEHERLFQQPRLEATFGGGEANVAVSLSLFGKDTAFVTVVPDHAVGDGAVTELRRYGVDTRYIQRKKGRLGIYFVETGACQRPSTVVYDREGSCSAQAHPGDFDWDAIFTDACWFHITGITPALSQGTADLAIEAVKKAKQKGLTVSVDLNYRKKLWNYGKKPPEVMRELVRFTDVVIANEEDIQMCLGLTADGVDVTKGILSVDDYRMLTTAVKQEFPNVTTVAVTMRESLSADRNGWSAVLSGKNGFHVSARYAIDDIIDRVGGGDSFSAGLIFGLLEYGDNEQVALDFAVAASCLKHTIPGDFNLTKRAEVEALAKGDGSGRVQR
jgi:2-dehydro-3-deoxygluconokinase